MDITLIDQHFKGFFNIGHVAMGHSGEPLTAATRKANGGKLTEGLMMREAAGGLGLFCMKARCAGEVLLELPLEACL